MKNKLLFTPLLLLLYCTAYAQGYFQVYAINASGFNIFCEGMPVKGGGIFSKYTSYLKANKKFLFSIETAKSLLPKGVEGSIKFKLQEPKYPGYAEVYFNNPVVGSEEFVITHADWPFTVQQVDANANIDVLHYQHHCKAIKILIDTTTYGPPGASGIKVSGSANNPAQNLDEPIPPVINFDWQVTQRSTKDEDDANDGKAYNTVTYFFTSNGDYAAVKPEDKSFSLMIYSKKGHTWMFDDKNKLITVMNMPKTVGEGGQMGKAIAEKIKKSPLQKDKDDEKFTIIKTGKTKNILGYTADEYEMKNNKVLATNNTSKSGTASFWYATVPFDPVKIYNMGIGRPADISKIQNDPKMKNNLFAIPMLNKNYLWVETSAGGRKGLETTEIKKVNNTVYTAGYKIKIINGLKDVFSGDDEK